MVSAFREILSRSSFAHGTPKHVNLLHVRFTPTPVAVTCLPTFIHKVETEIRPLML